MPTRRIQRDTGAWRGGPRGARDLHSVDRHIQPRAIGQREFTVMSASTNRSLDHRKVRLPGSVAEVEASPEGPKVGAFFDLDGTLVAGFTGVIMTQDRFRRREIGVGEFLGVVQAALNHQLGRADFEQLIYRGASM